MLGHGPGTCAGRPAGSCGCAGTDRSWPYEEKIRDGGQAVRLCRFSSPFIQLRLYNALSGEFTEESAGTWGASVLDPLDDLADVFLPAGLNLPALLRRYGDYLGRLKKKGLNPWQGQPRRQDLHIHEAVGHFHLYAWLREVLGQRCVISPEFPTGNGKVDLMLRWPGGAGVIEVKSFTQRSEMPAYKEQATRYARGERLSAATLAVFVPTEDEGVLKTLSGMDTVEGVLVTSVCFAWR